MMLAIELFTVVQLMIMFSLKNFICEFVIQTDEIAEAKRRYGSINSFRHILHHAFGTLMVLLIFTLPLYIALGLVLLEAILHYHVDWLHMKFGAQSYRDKKYWQWLGAEIFAHQLIYAILIILVTYYLTQIA